MLLTDHRKPSKTLGYLHDVALCKAQSELTRKETLYDVGRWLRLRFKLGWMAHTELPCPNPEVFELTFYKSDLDSLEKGIIPILGDR